MARDSASVVREIYASWGRGEIPGPPGLLDDRVEYVNPAGAVEPGTRRGLAEFAQAVEKTFESWEVWDARPERMSVRGERVAVLVRYHARGRGSGIEIDGEESALWTVRDGRAVRYEWFQRPTDAFEAMAS